MIKKYLIQFLKFIWATSCCPIIKPLDAFFNHDSHKIFVRYDKVQDAKDEKLRKKV